jgi:hypothetical protein
VIFTDRLKSLPNFSLMSYLPMRKLSAGFLVMRRRRTPDPVILQGRYTATAWSGCHASGRFPALYPKHHDALTEPIEFRRLTSRCPRSARFNHPFTQVQRIRRRHWSPQGESIRSDSRILNSLGIPPGSRRTEYALIAKSPILRLASRWYVVLTLP